ncbi:type I-E CRISPR-associated protein Cse1/CasA [Streptomyces sp. NPDC005533]|uniref:type I-E CRISPR-associated protein Cse1/CasA n=1 Tax=Streptomyces sp. NPDC005533 TaxID=3364723 RepID=UPI00368FF01E
MRSFDLVSRPWLPVQLCDGTAVELSLEEVFARAGDVRRLAGDVPSQDFALLRLLLAILHDAVDGPRDLDAWQELHECPEPFASVSAYLDRHRHGFDLVHPSRPFFQVPELRTQKEEVARLNRIVADVPNGDPFFTVRQPGVERLSFGEAARWVVHAHAFDTSGIKSGAVGDSRVKGGKGYPQGVGWAGNLGGVFVEGDSLRQTLLLNLVPSSALSLDKEDRPAWRREPCGPDVQHGLESRPTGPRDLYTWQSRRIRLHHDDQGVHGVVLAYGDPLASQDKYRYEPMSCWRRSKPQEMKLGRSPVYMPREHHPSRAAWRSLPSLLTSQAQERTAQHGEPTSCLRAGVLNWIAELTHQRLLPEEMLIRPRLIGARYGTQQSVIDELVDDGLTMPVVLLHQQDRQYAAQALGAVEDGSAGVGALGDLAAGLARAAGSDPGVARETARDRGFDLLDVTYRQWLAVLREMKDPGEARRNWQLAAHRILREAAESHVAAAGETGWLDHAASERTFLARLNRVFCLRYGTEADSVTEPEEPDVSKGGSAVIDTVPTVPAAPIWSQKSRGPAKEFSLLHQAVAQHIRTLQNDYLADRSHAVRALARLRRSHGCPADMPDLRGLGGVEQFFEHRLTQQHASARAAAEMPRAERAAHVAVALWAVHQQPSQTKHMHIAGGPSVGTAVRRLMSGTDSDAPIRKRLVRAGTASTLEVMAQRLRDLVVQLRAAEIPLDYGLLAEQLDLWQKPGGPLQVRRAWGRAFHAHRLPAATTEKEADVPARAVRDRRRNEGNE